MLMSDFTVSEVIDGDTFSVKGGWIWTKDDGTKVEGVTVRPTGYNTPESGKTGFDSAKNKLEKLINGKTVTLKNPVNVSYGRLVCDVYYDGKNLSDYFPEYKI